MSSIKLAAMIPNKKDGTSFYRGSGVLHSIPGVTTTLLEEYDWSTLSAFDALIMQRPATETHLKIAQLANRMNVPIILDFDDNLYDIPKHNPAHNTYLPLSASIKSIVNLADTVWVSTPELLKVYGERTVLIPNAYDTKFDILDRNDFKEFPNRNKLILWRGSATHDADLAPHIKDIHRFLEAHKDYKLVMIGQLSGYITSLLEHPRIQIVSAMAVDRYLLRIFELAPQVLIHPLEDTNFNKSKSNCAWLEATHAGAICVTTNHSEFPNEYCIKSNNLFNGLVRAIDPQQAKLPTLSRSYIKDNYSLAKMNKLRSEYIRRLVSLT